MAMNIIREIIYKRRKKSHEIKKTQILAQLLLQWTATEKAIRNFYPAKCQHVSLTCTYKHQAYAKAESKA